MTFLSSVLAFRQINLSVRLPLYLVNKSDKIIALSKVVPQNFLDVKFVSAPKGSGICLGMYPKLDSNLGC